MENSKTNTPRRRRNNNSIMHFFYQFFFFLHNKEAAEIEIYLRRQYTLFFFSNTDTKVEIYYVRVFLTIFGTLGILLNSRCKPL